jgi:hypothetical protein
MSQITDRIEREIGVPGLAAALAERLAPTDLQSLLLEVYRRRAGRRGPAAVLADYESNRFVRPSALAPGRLLEWERVALAQLPPEFEAVELSPVCPLGTNSVMASVSQDWAVATSRNVEVVSDATNVLALEAAVRRRALLRAEPRSRQAVHLACSHRLLRPQQYRDPKLVPHFRLFALCSAGRDLGGSAFELQALALHIRFYLRALRAFAGPALPLHVFVTAFASARAASAEALLASLPDDTENVTYALAPERTAGQGYYPGLCFHVYAAETQLADGGVVDWTQRLMNNAKERLAISGIGSERVCSLTLP